MIQKKLQKQEKIYRVKAQHNPVRVPDRLPDVFVNINRDGRVYCGINIKIKRGSRLFDYVASRCGVRVLKKAMMKAGNTKPQDIEMHFKYHDRKSAYLCRIYRFNHHFLIGGWMLSGNLIRFPDKDTAA